MASTNKTTNYELSQYVGTDKPTYLGDYNSDMLKIDSAIHGVAENVGTETSRINIIENNIGSLSNLSTTDKTNVVNAINEVNIKSNNNTTNIGTLSNLETTNKTTLVNAINEIVNNLDLSNHKTYDLTSPSTEMVATNINLTRLNLYVSTNSTGSLFKVYGEIRGSLVAHQTNSIRLKNTGINPSSSFTINNAGIQQDDTLKSLYSLSVYVENTGDIVISFGDSSSNDSRRGYLTPCLYIANNFGDSSSN